eukprot:6614994-Prymnesium_polylepis.1
MDLSGSEQFMLLAGGITMLGALDVPTSKCCGMECDRQVVDLTASDTEHVLRDRFLEGVVDFNRPIGNRPCAHASFWV